MTKQAWSCSLLLKIVLNNVVLPIQFIVIKNNEQCYTQFSHNNFVQCCRQLRTICAAHHWSLLFSSTVKHWETTRFNYTCILIQHDCLELKSSLCCFLQSWTSCAFLRVYKQYMEKMHASMTHAYTHSTRLFRIEIFDAISCTIFSSSRWKSTFQTSYGYLDEETCASIRVSKEENCTSKSH